MKYCYLLLSLLIFACNSEKSDQTSSGDSDKPVNDTIPLTRTSINNLPIASYSEKIEDPLNDWRFAVEVYETKATFDFLMKIEYMALDAQDTLKIPNFGIMPKVEVRKGPEKQSCIVGFLDKKGEFKEYKMVALKNKQLKISTLKYYARTRYKVKK